MTTASLIANRAVASLRNPQPKQQWAIEARLTDGLATTPLYQVANKRVTLNLHAGQLAAWDSNKRFVFMLAGTQGGKTSYLPFLLLRDILLYGAGDYIAATATYKLFSRKFLPVMLELFEHVLGIGRYWSQGQMIEIKNPFTDKFEATLASDKMYARVLLGSAQAAGSLESATAKSAILDECGQTEFKLIAYEAVLRRLSLAQGRVYGGTTLYDLGWLKSRIYDPFRKQSPDIDVIQFESSINPAFPQEEMDRARRDMPNWKFLMFYKGEFSNPPGQIYADFIDQYRETGGHKVKGFSVPAEWLRYVGIDPGVIHQAVGWYAFDPIGKCWFKYREQMVARKTQKEHALDAMAMARKEGVIIAKWCLGAISEIYHRQDWIDAGAKGVVQPPTKEVEKRIDAVTGLFRNYQLFIFEDCVETLDQLLTYSREVDENGDPTDKIKDKEKFHFMDEMGYFALHAFKPSFTPPKATFNRVY